MTPAQQADDVHRLLPVLGGAPAYVFGSSGGAVVGFALVTAHTGQVRTLVAHEPAVVELLPDSAQLRAQIQDICDTYRANGADKAMAKFMTHAGLGEASGQEAGAPRWEPSPEQMARMRATTEVFLAHLIRPTTRYQPTSRRCGRHQRASWSPPGPHQRGSSPTAALWHSPTGSVPPQWNSPVTMADSWPCLSNSSACCTRCSPRRPDPADPAQEPADASLITERKRPPERGGAISALPAYTGDGKRVLGDSAESAGI
jgi:pimeloyl-ACP methyl ester carboxylesterase